MTLRWEPPPVPGVDKVDWTVVGPALKAKPGEWAWVEYSKPGTAAQVAHQINRRKKHATLHALGVFEALSRTVDGSYRLYVRYVGPAAGSTTENGEPRG